MIGDSHSSVAASSGSVCAMYSNPRRIRSACDHSLAAVIAFAFR